MTRLLTAIRQAGTFAHGAFCCAAAILAALAIIHPIWTAITGDM